MYNQALQSLKHGPRADSWHWPEFLLARGVVAPPLLADAATDEQLVVARARHVSAVAEESGDVDTVRVLGVFFLTAQVELGYLLARHLQLKRRTYTL